MKPRIKIITAYDTAYSPVGEICATSIRLFATQHGYDYSILPLPAIDRPPPWGKITILLDQLSDESIDFVMWIDADAAFVRGDVDIAKEIEDGKDLLVVSNLRPMPGSRNSTYVLLTERPNTGVMVIRRCGWSMDMLEALWRMEQYVHHIWWENAALLEYLGLRSELTGNADDNRPIADRLAHVKWLYNDWNCVPPHSYQHIGETETPIIVHFAGFPFNVRLHCMSRLSYRSGPLAPQLISRVTATGMPLFSKPLAQRPSDRLTVAISNVKPTFSIDSGLISRSGYYAMGLQSDGNLVIYYTNGWLGSLSNQPAATPSIWNALWASNTFNHGGDGPNYVVFQLDGNLVVYDHSGSPLWAAGCEGQGGTTLVMQDDGDLVIYDATGNSLWATNTAGRTF